MVKDIICVACPMGCQISVELNDDTWNEFVDTCNSMGLPEIIEVYQNAYDEYQAGER